VPFNSRSVFSTCPKHFIGKTKIALREIMNILFRSRCNSWKSKCKLFESICVSSLLYGAEIWAIDKSESLETIQSSFIKFALNLPRCTANYLARIEGNRFKIEYNIFKRSMKFLTKILEMEDTRIPNLVRRKLNLINESTELTTIPNWSSQLQLLMNKVDPSIQIKDLAAVEIRENLHSWCETFRQKLFLEDVERVVYSSCNNRYKHLLAAELIPPYLLNAELAPSKISLLAQLRCCPDFYYRIKLYNYSLTLNSDDTCPCCSSESNYNWHHIIFCCEKHSDIRTRFLRNYMNIPYDRFIELIKNPPVNFIDEVHDFLLFYMRSTKA